MQVHTESQKQFQGGSQIENDNLIEIWVLPPNSLLFSLEPELIRFAFTASKLPCPAHQRPRC